MADSQKITPVIIISGIVIFLSILILICYSPVLYQVHNILNLQPEAICLYPPAEEKTMSTIWDVIVDRTGIDSSSAAFDGMDVVLTPDETIEGLSLSFYATRDGEGRMFTAYLRYDRDHHCGTLNIQSSPSGKPDFATVNPVSPREFLMELPQVKLSRLGITNRTAFISTGVSRERNTGYESSPCMDLLLFENRTFIPLNTMEFPDSEYAANHWTIHPERCITLPESGTSCSSERSILIFTESRIPGAVFIRKTTGDGPPILLNACPHGPAKTRSCKTTLFGSGCTNWTEY